MYYVKYVLVKSPESTLAGAKDGKFDRKFQISARLCQEIQDTQRDSTSSTSQPWLRKVGIGKHPISSNIIQSSNHQQYQQSNNNPIIQPYHPIIQSSNNPTIPSSNRQSNHLVMGRIDTEAIHCLVEGLLLPFTWQILASMRIGSRCHKMTQLGTTHLAMPR